MNTVEALDTQDERSLGVTDGEVNSIIANSTAKASAVAALPIPLVDIAGVAYVQMKMLEKLSGHYEIPLEDKSSILISSIVSGLISKLCADIFNTLASNTSLDKFLSETMIKASVAGFMTTITGEVYHNHIKNGGTPENIGVENFIDYAKSQIASDRVSVGNISNAIMDKVMSKVNL